MISKEILVDRLKSYANMQLDSLAQSNIMIKFAQPLVTRAINNNTYKLDSMLSFITDKDGNIDIENILDEMVENIMSSKKFVYNTSFLGDVTLGDGQISFNLPVINRKITLNRTDFDIFKNVITNK